MAKIDFSNFDREMHDGKYIRKKFESKVFGDIYVYMPSIDDEVYIMNLLSENMSANDGQIKFELTDDTVLQLLIPRLTNIEFDIEKHKDLYDKLKDSNLKIFNDIMREIKIITSEMAEDLVERLKELNDSDIDLSDIKELDEDEKL